MIGVLTTHHCHNGLLPLPVAPSQDAEYGLANTSSFPLCPDHRPGPTLMRSPAAQSRPIISRTVKLRAFATSAGRSGRATANISIYTSIF